MKRLPARARPALSIPDWSTEPPITTRCRPPTPAAKTEVGKCQVGSRECNAARRYAYSNSTPDPDPDADRNTNTDANRNSNTDSDIHANADANCDTDTHSNPNTNCP